MDRIANGKVSPFLIHRFAVPLPPRGKVLCGTHPNKFQLIAQRIKFDKHIRKTDSSIGARFYRSNRR